jgi:hypothetical protein
MAHSIHGTATSMAACTAAWAAAAIDGTTHACTPGPHLTSAPRAAVQVGMLVMGPEFNSQFETFYKIFMQQLAAVVPPTVNIPEA